jgi:hypothetical protein
LSTSIAQPIGVQASGVAMFLGGAFIVLRPLWQLLALPV